MASIKGNIVLNGINTVTSILFPMVTFPYAARVLLPDGIGAVNFLNSIIGYIVLLTSVGIPLYAVKEIAKYRDDKVLRDKTTVEILILSSILCLIGYIGVWFLAEYIPRIHQQISLFYIISLTIVFNAIGVNWFYQGIEDFKFITYRAIAIRILSTSFLFIFVKSPDDILVYGAITVGATVGNNFINFIHLRKYIDIAAIRIQELEIARHVKPALHVFILNLIISLYVQLNTIMLGFMSGDKAVGYFTAGTKISHIGLVLISSVGIVLLPRCSNLLQKGDNKGFANVINKSSRLTVALSLPMIIGLMILSTPITLIFCGKEYIDSIPVLYLNAPVILLIGLTNVMGIQVLYPKDKVNIVIWSVAGGAIINVIFNLIFIPDNGATGAAIATLIAEMVVFVLQAVLGRRYFPFHWRDIFKPSYFLSAFLMGLAVWVISTNITDIIVSITLSIASGIVTYSLSLFLMKDDLFNDMLRLSGFNKLLKHH